MLFSQNKQKYGFILGHCPELSRAEIVMTLEFLKIEYQTVFFSDQIFIIEANGRIDVQGLQDRLGGIIKVSSIKYQVSRNDLSKAEELILKRFEDLRIEGLKFQFGFSAYGGINVKELNKIGLNIKKQLTAQGIKSRLVVSRESALSSVIVQKEKLIESGADIVVVKVENQYYLGFTLTVQKFEDYSRRDYGRPNRDDKSGMLPPKLAKIMLNLAQAEAGQNQSLIGQTILDPFCGSGTVIQEALLLGYQKIIGGDISAKAVESTRNNLEWLKRKFGADVSGVEVHQYNVKELSNLLPLESVDAIITEPYLGPARTSTKFQAPSNKQIPNHESQISNTIKELEELYLKAFGQFYQVLKKEGKVVIIFPIIQGEKLNIINDIKWLGFTVESLGQEPRRSIVYSRPGQTVEREIFIFHKR